MTTLTDTQQPDAITVDQVHAVAARLDSRAPGTPPWAWPNLAPADAALLDRCLDEFVESYNRIHASKVEEVIPRCWRMHPPLAQELPVQFWAWWASHIDPKTSINNALEYYNRNLPAFQGRLETRLLGKGAVNCRKGQHRNLVDPELTAAISYDALGPTEQTGRGPDNRRALHQTDFGTQEGNHSCKR